MLQSDSMANSVQADILLTVVEGRKRKVCAKVFLVTACCACAAVVPADAKVPLFAVSFQSSAFMACRAREGSTDF